MQRGGGNNISAVRREIMRRRVWPTLAHSNFLSRMLCFAQALERVRVPASLWEVVARLKAMRGRIALQKHCVRNQTRMILISFRVAFGVRTRPRVAFAPGQYFDLEIVGHVDLIGLKRIHRFHKPGSRVAFKPWRRTPRILIRYWN